VVAVRSTTECNESRFEVPKFGVDAFGSLRIHDSVMNDPVWRRSWKKRAQLAAIAGVGYPLLAALGATYRYRVDGLEHLRAAQALGQPIHAFWHGRILPGTIYFRHRGIVVITSENFDGEWIARIITKFGFGTARGSSSRGARKALLQLIRDVRERPVAFTLDGPRGPARVAQPGAVWLAKVTGNPIIPFHLEADRHWTLKSWDRTQIPKPFATIAVAFAPPIQVGAAASDSTLEQVNHDLEASLAQCERRCAELLCR
jgi:lysophospholipid acyltransferase (LPLAT)-like uncharacterized protein